MNLTVPEAVASEIERLQAEKGIPRETTLRALADYLFRTPPDVARVVGAWLSGEPFGPMTAAPDPVDKAAKQAKVSAMKAEAKKLHLGVGARPANADMPAPGERFTRQKPKARTPETIE